MAAQRFPCTLCGSSWLQVLVATFALDLARLSMLIATFLMDPTLLQVLAATFPTDFTRLTLLILIVLAVLVLLQVLIVAFLTDSWLFLTDFVRLNYMTFFVN